MNADEERIALFLDYENLAIGAREHVGNQLFDFKPIADALAERGRVIVRRAYGDWGKFNEDGRMLTRHHVELIEIPQRMGTVRKNAADIKMAVDAVELCFERDYITTFVLGTGDSDFTPLVHKLRELNRRVIGLGIQSSTSALLPPACDEFLFYERLEGVELRKRRSTSSRGPRGRGRRPPSVGAETSEPTSETVDLRDAVETADETADGELAAAAATTTVEDAQRLITQTLSGLERTGGGPVRASSLKRAILRKDSTFNEADFGFRGFTELLRNLAERGVITLSDTAALGDPEVLFPSESGEEDHTFDLLAEVVATLSARTGGTPLSGLKTQLRRSQPDFSEKRIGYGGFLQFAKAAAARGAVTMAWDDDADDYILRPAGGANGGPVAEELPDVSDAPAPRPSAVAGTRPGRRPRRAVPGDQPAGEVDEAPSGGEPRDDLADTAPAEAPPAQTEPAPSGLAVPPASAPSPTDTEETAGAAEKSRAIQPVAEAASVSGDEASPPPPRPRAPRTRRAKPAEETSEATSEGAAPLAPADEAEPPRRRTTRTRRTTAATASDGDGAEPTPI